VGAVHVEYDARAPMEAGMEPSEGGHGSVMSLLSPSSTSRTRARLHSGPVFGRIAAAVLRRPGAVMLGLAVVLVVAVLGLLRLRIDLSPTAFYRADDEAALAAQRLAQRWGPDDATIAVLATAADGTVLAPDRLTVLRTLAGELRAVDRVARVDTVAEHPAAARGPDDPGLPALQPLLLAVDLRTAVVAVDLDFASGEDLAATVATVDRVRAVVRAHEGDAGLAFELAGVPAVRASFASTVVSDQRVLVPLCLATIAGLLYLLHRSRHAVLIPAVCAFTPTAVLLGIMGWAGAPIGLLSQGYFTLLPIIAVAEAVHLVSRAGEEATRIAPHAPPTRAQRDTAIVATLRHVGFSGLLTSSTTAVGFASLALSEMPMLRAFGAWAALGVLLGYATLVLVGPLLLAQVDDPRPPPRAAGVLAGPLVRLTSISVRRPWLVLAIAGALGTAAVVFARDIPVDNYLSDLVDERDPVARAGARLDRELGGTLSLQVELAAAPGTFAGDEALARIDAFERWAAEQPEVRAVMGPSHLAAIEAAALPLGRPGLRPRVPGVRARVIDRDESHARVVLHLPDLGGRAFARLQRRVEARAAEIEGTTATVSSAAAIAYAGINRISAELGTSLLGVFAVVTAAIAIAFKSARLGITSAPPNLLPLVLGYAALALIFGRLDPLGAIVLVVALGIAVDDTIHLIARTLEHVGAGATRTEAVTEAIRSTGWACAVSSTVLCAGLALFGLSSFPPLRLLGHLGATVIAIALLCDLWVLPAMLVLVLPRRPSAAPTSRTGS